ncbi:MAG: helicase-related protein [Myxococcota bacterium]
MSNFITNCPTRQLKNRMRELLVRSREAKFLVGFFYFSGLKELYEGIKNNPDIKLKVLVGLNVDKTNYGLIEYAENNLSISDEERIYRYFESIKKSINSEHFDNKDFYEQVRFFIELIKADRLIIRKTFEPNHSKLYIFKLDPSQVARDTLFITGSSNLTKSGLTHQEEFNVEISDYGIEDAENYFDEHWERGVKITEFTDKKQKLIDLLENETLIKQLTPFEAYVLVLKNYLETYISGDTDDEAISNIMRKNRYIPYRYQIDAVKQALDIIENNNGVIIADVVGLGKTIIACLVARQLRKRGIVLCPPGILGDEKIPNSGWRWYLESFSLYDWRAESIGMLDDENFVKSIKSLKDIEVIIIDEAHRFRNEDTKSYEQLKNLCRNKIVILLTATPFNNRPGDILSLLKLFITPKKSTITLENNLTDKFRIFKTIFDKLGYIKKYHNSTDKKKLSKAQSNFEALFGTKQIDLKKVMTRTNYLAKQIRDVIEPVTIRRNRLDLQKNPFYKNEIKELTRVSDPQEWLFELSKEQSQFYDQVIKYFTYPEEGGRFIGAIYRPFEYKIDRKDIQESEENNRRYQQQRNLYDFMRRLLVKRFESSFGAFKKSIENFKNITEHCLDFINKTQKFILDRGLLEKIWTLEIDEIERELIEYSKKITDGVYPKNHEIYEVDKFKYQKEFLEGIKSDLKLFEEILKKLTELNLVDNDPKLKELIEKLKEWRQKEPERKIIIFSEYIDTVNYLKAPLLKDFKNRVLVVAGDLSENKIEEINKNFDAAYPESDKKDDYDILLCTDKISEGFNLNRAGLVINYDIPWNPVRVIQRVGRINRIGKRVFADIFIANFFPTERGAELVNSKEIAAQKMFLIHNAIGEDAKIFDIDEEPSPSGLYQKIQQNPDELESESFYTKVLNEYEEIKRKYPEVIKRIENCPLRVKVAKKFTEDELIVFIRKRRIYVHRVDYNGQYKPQPVILEEVIDRIRCPKEEKSLELSGNFWNAYEVVKDIREEIMAIPEQSLEQKALNNLKTLIGLDIPVLILFKDFLRTLREDIIDYGTLSDYTLRRIVNLKFSNKNEVNKTMKELEKLKEELGEDYLVKERIGEKSLYREIIIAIENQKGATNGRNS